MEPTESIKKEEAQMARLEELRRKIYTPLADMAVLYAPSDEPVAWEEHDTLAYRPLPENGEWADLFGCAWFRIEGKIPTAAAGMHVAAHIDLGGEGLVYRRGGEKLPVGAVTHDMSFIDRLQACTAKTLVDVANPAQGGEWVALDIDAGFNDNYPYPTAHFQCAELCAVDDDWLEYYYDYLTVASLMSWEEEETRKQALRELLEESYAAKIRSLEEARTVLAGILQGQADDSLVFTATGHSHLDLAWLWPLRETKRKACRTFAHQITNMQRYPEYVYGASQPQQFQFVKESHPQLYHRLQKFAKRGQLECQGAMWVEADNNLPSGEALIRQIVYGKRFFREEFGQEMNICWLPDVFGYNGNLPQLLKKSGIPYFLTIKLSWNEHNRFPYRSFVWRGIDGSEVLTHMPPADDYNATASPPCTSFAKSNYTEGNVSHCAVMLYGLGDGGGGPGEAHIEMVRRQASLQGSPAVRMGAARDFFKELEQERTRLPGYQGELYLEKHQGTYTTQAHNKRSNRKCEYALQNLEALCTGANLRGYPYPRETLERLWKHVLLLQFHDILPGSSIRRVYQESAQDYDSILQELEQEQSAVLAFLARQDEGYSAYNPVSFARTVYVKKEGTWWTGTVPPHGAAPLAAWHAGVRDAAAGVQNAEVGAQDTAARKAVPDHGGCGAADCLDNGLVCIRFAPDGSICSLMDRSDGFDYVSGSGRFLNRLTLYEDEYLPYNAWDIDWEYYKKPFSVLTLVETETKTDGPARIRRNVYRCEGVELVQEVILYPDAPTVYFHTVCCWHKTLKMLRADFKPAVWSDQITCDIQMGAIRRSTREDTPQEKAQFEICAHKYVDISDETHGISLLNDCKYGHRAKNGLLSLNLLRGTTHPDPQADQGEHEFTYALFVHKGSSGEETVAQSYYLNQPSVILQGQLSLDSMACSSRANVVVETIKKAEDDSGIILRLYEAVGKETVAALKLNFAALSVWECDMEENPVTEIDPERLSFGAFEIKTLKVILRKGEAVSAV